MKDYRKMLEEVGGYENEMTAIPAGAVREMVAEIEQLRDAVKFYGGEAEAIARHFNKNDGAVLASVTVLKLDGGIRAKKLVAI